jgi:hypothetical protein
MLEHLFCGKLIMSRLVARVLFNAVKYCYNFIDPLGFAHPCNSLDNWKLNGSFAFIRKGGNMNDNTTRGTIQERGGL